MKKVKSLLKQKLFFVDYKLFLPILVLMFIGLMAIIDVSAPKAMEIFGDRFYFSKQQLTWIVVGLLIYLLVSQVNIMLWSKFSVLIYFTSIIFLILVLVPGVGIKTLGARRWIDLGIINFQPSEFAKLAICLYIAKLSSMKKKLIAYILPIIVTAGLVMLQPDFGTTVVICIISFIQLFFSGVHLKYLFVILLVGSFLALLLIFSSDYRKERVVSFLNPINNDSSQNYHIKQVLYSLAIGGVGGSGIGQSKQKYLFLPEATTDSIFAIIAEETGYFGVVVIIGIYIFISLRMIFMLREVKDTYLVVLAVGIYAWFMGQTCVNLGSISSLIPFTGVPLPFISYGGSTLVSLLIGFALFNSVIKYNKIYGN